MANARQPNSPVPVSGLYPVTLVYFKGEHIPKKYNLLKWHTAQEINADYFILEKSNNGLAFRELQKIKAKGTTNTPAYYDAQDTEWSDITYYRLRQVDFDGSFYYSNVISIDAIPAPLSIQNPFKNQLEIQIESTEEWSWCIFSSKGSCLRKGVEDETMNTILINTQDWPSGIYLLTIKSGENLWVRRLVKQ